MLSKPERTHARRGHRAVLVGGAVSLAALGGGVGLGVFAGANPPSTTDVRFVKLATPFKLLTAKSIATNGTYSAVVIGGTTAIPTNATTVELNVSAGGTTAGTLNIYPAGNVGGGSGQSVSWTGGSTGSATVQENVGLKDELTFALTGATAKVTATITGYSTQVTDGDVSGLDGSQGQVLTDTGAGAAWQNAPGVAATADQETPQYNLQGGVFSIVASVNVAAGAYELLYTGDLYNSGAAEFVQCEIVSPSGAVVDMEQYLVPANAGSMIEVQGLDNTSGGQFTVQCRDVANQATIGYAGAPDFVAMQVSSASGAVAFGPAGAHSSKPGLPAR